MKKNLGGRPLKYMPEYDDKAYKLCLTGFTLYELGKYLNVTERTIQNWMVRYKGFSIAVQKGRDLADAEVVLALYQRATGYSHEETKVNVVDGEVIKTVITKYYPPDTAAVSLWLRNRQPKYWKDRVETKEEVNVDAFPSQDVLDAIYQKGLSDAAERERCLIGRRERLGISLVNC